MGYRTIELVQDDSIATLTLNRPDKLNAVTREMLNELLDAFHQISENKNLGVVVLTGAGNAFSVGGDFDWDFFETKDPAQIKGIIELAGKLAIAMRSLQIPLIASVNGVAAGGGLSMVLACDIVFASERARFGSTFIKWGGLADGGANWFLPRRVGTAKAIELLLTGDVIDAREAKRIGLVDNVVSPELLERTTMDLAAKFAKAPKTALRITKQTMNQALRMELSEAVEMEARGQVICFLHPDREEGIKAFREKREPKF